jgi:nitrate/TMAO reductase-like tetraheme cytochrome c subunit
MGCNLLSISPLADGCMKSRNNNLKQIVKTVQVVSIVAGVLFSVYSFNLTNQKETEARIAEAQKPLYELRRKVYVETVKTAAIIATPTDHTPEEVSQAMRRFRELYIAELSMVEDAAVATNMFDLAQKVDASLAHLTPAQNAALNLSHALRDSYIAKPVSK